METQEMTKSPRLYVGTYAKYNNGNLFGEWVNLENFYSSEDFYEYCKELHKDEEDPEFMFQDCENVPDQLYSECGNIDQIYEYWDAIKDLSDTEQEAFRIWVENGYGDYSDYSSFKDEWQGEWDSLEAYAENWLEETGCLDSIPENLRYYFDYEKYARDLEYSGDCSYIDGHVFLNH